jgi:hypothetical protein
MRGRKITQQGVDDGEGNSGGTGCYALLHLHACGYRHRNLRRYGRP